MRPLGAGGSRPFTNQPPKLAGLRNDRAKQKEDQDPTSQPSTRLAAQPLTPQLLTSPLKRPLQGDGDSTSLWGGGTSALLSPAVLAAHTNPLQVTLLEPALCLQEGCYRLQVKGYRQDSGNPLGGVVPSPHHPSIHVQRKRLLSCQPRVGALPPASQRPFPLRARGRGAGGTLACVRFRPVTPTGQGAPLQSAHGMERH